MQVEVHYARDQVALLRFPELYRAALARVQYFLALFYVPTSPPVKLPTTRIVQAVRSTAAYCPCLLHHLRFCRTIHTYTLAIQQIENDSTVHHPHIAGDGTANADGTLNQVPLSDWILTCFPIVMVSAPTLPSSDFDGSQYMRLGPLYARYYRSDLHMHSPLDAKWEDTGTRLGYDSSDEDRKEVARLYLRACHEAELEVIALTDHNFAPNFQHSFVFWLRSENGAVAKELQRPPLVIFAGFEIQANVGKGCHILCIFGPETPLDVVDGRLSALDLPADRRYRDRQPQPTKVQLDDILRVVQHNGSDTGLVVAPHPFDRKGLLRDEEIEMWLQREEFTNNSLLCMEVPKQPQDLPPGLWKMIQAESDCLPDWRRERPIACIMSSDCSSLRAAGKESKNHIGFRHTWIKMSRPSIEALRQAFLDPESRIRFGPICPDLQYTHPRIRSVVVQGASFLRRPEGLEWSPNLNCVIGSRGSGKSTLVDYVRAALDRLRDEDVPVSLKKETQDRFKDTLGGLATVEVGFENRGVKYRVVYSRNQTPQHQVFVGDSDTPDRQLDIRALFPARFLSQREIDHSVAARDKTALLKFLDDFIRPELAHIDENENSIKGQIQQVEAALSAKLLQQNQRASVETELRDLQNILEGQILLSQVLPLWRGAESERVFFDRLFREVEEVFEQRNRLVSQCLQSTASSGDLEGSSNCKLIAEAAEHANAALGRLRLAVEAAFNEFEAATLAPTSPLRRLHFEQWQPLYDEVRRKLETAQAEASAAGIQLQAVGDIPARLLQLQAKLKGLDDELREIEGLELQRSVLVSSLHVTWRNQTEARVRKARELMERLRPSPDGKPYVDIQIDYQGDFEATLRALADRIKDKRRLNDEDIERLMTALQRQAPLGDIPLMSRFIVESRKGVSDSVLREALDKKLAVFLTTYSEPVLRELETRRVPDLVTYRVYRQDGTLAGPIDKVSAGQQGTAILNLLLAAGNEPLIVDTPEEGLDSEGVYAELVPLFRREKEKRQVIIVTHNANLPVNADAEGIVALEATGFVPDQEMEEIILKSGQQIVPDQIRYVAELVGLPDWQERIGKYLTTQKWPSDAIARVLKEIGDSRMAEGRVKCEWSGSDVRKRYAVGALDTPEVKRAVQNIMEGSEKAFRRRREKYGF